MSIEFYSLLILECENNYCEESLTISVEEGEKKEDAIEMAKTLGWSLEEGVRCQKCNGKALRLVTD